VRRSRSVSAAVVISLAVAGLAPAAASADDLAPVGTCPGADLPTSSIGEQVSGMLCLVNYARGQHGLNALATSPVLNQSAGLKADDEVACNDFSHTPCGKPVSDPFERAGYVQDGYEWKIGENLAKATAPLGAPRNVMDSWLNSPEHRENILSPDWTEQGLALQTPGSFLGLTGSAIWVSHFGERHQVPPETAPAAAGGAGGGATTPAKAGKAKKPARCARLVEAGGRAAGVGLASKARSCKTQQKTSKKKSKKRKRKRRGQR
jgi:uncharacterized protein YkwD